MMEEQRFKVPRVSDRTLLMGLAAIHKTNAVTAINISSFGFAAISIAQADDLSGAIGAVIEADAFLVSQLTFHYCGLNWAYQRGGFDAKSPIYDEFRCVKRPQTEVATSADYIHAVANLTRQFRPFDAETSDGTSDAVEKISAIHESTLTRLELALTQLVEQGVEQRKKLEEEFVERTQRFREAQEEEHKREVDRIAEAERELKEAQAALEKRAQELDASDNTHARRQIRTQLLKDVEQRMREFGVSASTEGKRRPVAYGMGALACLFLGVIAVSFNELSYTEAMQRLAAAGSASSTGSSPDWFLSPRFWLWIRISLSTVGLVATVLYYVKWQNQWATHHAELEFNLQQFHLDVNRANWIIESCLEWRKETKSPIPAELLASMTRGLFSSTAEKSTQVLHPADELASALMGSASKLNLDIAGNKIEIDKPGRIPKSMVSKPAEG